MKSAIGAAALALLVGCATQPEKIGSTYVSPGKYRDYDCDQINVEIDNVNRRAAELEGSLNKIANTDSLQMAVGLVLFWPTLFFLEGGDGPEAAEYAQMKGEREALEEVSVQKKCYDIDSYETESSNGSKVPKSK